MKRILVGLLAGVIVCMAGSPSLWAQATAQISGTAKDQSGAVLPGVEIKVTQAETGIARDAVTNETGTYVLPNLPIGPYKLEATLPGVDLPLYTMVTFTRIPYAEAQSRARLQDRIVYGGLAVIALAILFLIFRFVIL